MVIRLGVGPSRQCLRLPDSPPAAGARRLVGPPAAGLLADRPAPRLGVLPVAGYYSLALDDKGFAEVSMATVPPPGKLSL